SGLQRGCSSHARPCVSAWASPPPTGMTYRSPSRSNTICLPSGLTSTLIHVPRRTSIFTSWCSPGGSSTFHLPGDALGVLPFVLVPEPDPPAAGPPALGFQGSSGSPPPGTCAA